MKRTFAAVVLLSASCSSRKGDHTGAAAHTFVAVTFNTGTSENMGHDNEPDDGYTSAHAEISDQYYGDGLAWTLQ